METTVAPSIYMIQTWFTYKKMANDYGNLLIYKPDP